MTFSTADGIFVISANAIMTIAIAAVFLIVGYIIKNKFKVFEKYCIPAPVIGGFLFMLVNYIGHATETFAVQFDTYYQSPFMLAFFVTVGLGASYKLLLKGGLLLIIYWLTAGIISICQNIIGIAVSKIVHLDPAYALLSSAISMIGGHGAALSYGKNFVEAGHPQGQLIGAAAATFGLVTAVMIGGPLGRRLIVKNNLKPSDEASDVNDDIKKVNADSAVKLTHLDIIKNVTAIIVCMALGTQVSGYIGSLVKMDFPSYVGAMLLAIIVRNLNDVFKFYNFSFSLVDSIGDVMLNLFLSIALISLKLWELSGLLGGVLAVLICQVIFMALVAYFIVFRVLGKNYDAAVMCAGLCGHGLGATPSAIVNMTAVTDKYGMSKKAFIIVPIVGAFMVDIIYQPQTLAFIKYFVKIN